jgi:NAD(P)H-dependent flavin oxidoreductase YrpB (nitropropane dioxygenase family)
MTVTSAWQRYQEMTGIEYPIVQDGMGPMPTTMVATAVSNAGGLGSVSCPSIVNTSEKYLRDGFRSAIEYLAAHTDRPFAVNVPVGRVATGELLLVSEACISEAIAAKLDGGKVGQQLVALTTSAGYPGEFIGKIKAAGLIHQAKVGSVRHAVKARDAGTDVIIASGYEMGGHTHVNGVHTMVLAPQVIDLLDCPVIVSGGICDGRGLAAVLAMGGAAVAMGTRFIATQEHEWHAKFKQRVVDTPEWGDQVFPGVYAPCRGLKSPGLEKLPEALASKTPEEFQEWEEGEMRRAMRDGDIETGLLPGGQVAAALHDMPTVDELIQRMVAQAGSLLGSAASLSIGAVPASSA